MPLPVIGLAKVLIDGVKALVRDPNRRDEQDAEIEKLAVAYAQGVEETYRQEVVTRERIIVAELQQGDAYTKRARPTVIYVGLIVGLWNSLFSAVWQMWGNGAAFVAVDPGAAFWTAWGGICGLYVWARSRYDKTGKTVPNVSELVPDLLTTRRSL